jgi:hypothetical protein
MTGLALHRLVIPAIMAAADFCQPIPAPYDAGSTRQVDRPPRVRRATFPLMPAAFTTLLSVQIPGFEDIGLLTQYGRLVCDFCSSGQCFVTPWCDFLRIPPRGGHPCLLANRSPCLAGRGLSPPSHSTATTAVETAPFKTLHAMPGAPKRRQRFDAKRCMARFDFLNRQQ